MSTVDQRAITAEHEAAHAIVGLAKGHEVYLVSATENVCRHIGPAFDGPTVAAAGPVVEDRYRFRGFDARLRDYEEACRDQLEDLVGDFGDVMAYGETYGRVAYAAAIRILDRHADDHAKLTRFLIEHGEAHAGDLEALGLDITALD